MKTPSYIRLPLAPTQVTGDRDTSQRDVSHTFALKKAGDRDSVSVMGLLPFAASPIKQVFPHNSKPKKVFPRRDSNPGLAGESRVS